MTAPRPAESPGERLVWHATVRQLARALGGVSTTSRRLYVFDIPPRLMRGLYAASFAGAEGSVHRCLAPYYDPATLREEREPLERAVRRLGLPVVDGRLEVGASTGDLLHYFLANVDAAQGAGEELERRRQNLGAWVGAVQGMGGGEVHLRSVDGPGPGPILAASAGREHLLIRLGAEAAAVADVLRRLAYRERRTLERIGAGSALHRDIMGEWAGRRAGA